MNYAEALEYLEAHYSLELSPSTRATEPNISRMVDLAQALGDVDRGIPTIHVAGTNGKGSTSRIIIGLVAAHGLHVGSYNSPHLQRVNERISSNGVPIDDDTFAAAVSDVAAIEPLLADKWDRPATYFEVIAATALSWMATSAVDVRVIEVGMGGRWDATNVVDAEVAVVTNIGLDHVYMLGPELTDIAREKAGIITPVSAAVIGDVDDEIFDVIAEMPAASTLRMNSDYEIVANQLAVGGRSISVHTARAHYDDVFLSLNGAHQALNAAVAIVAVEEFFDRALDADLVAEALGSVSVPGRFEVLGRQPLTIVDGAHNLDGAVVAAATMADDFRTDGNRVLVAGFNSPRDPAEMLDALGAVDATAVVATQPDWPLRIPADQVVEAATTLGVNHVVWEPNVARAVDTAREIAGPDGVVLVAGSLYVAGAAREHLKRTVSQ